MSVLDYTVATISNALAEMQPYITLGVDLSNNEVGLTAAIYRNGNEEETWTGLTVAEFEELYGLHKDGDYFRIIFPHADSTSDDFTDEQVHAMLALLGIDTGNDPQPVVRPVQSVVTIGYSDITKMISEAIDLNGGACGVELDGVRWIVQFPVS